MKMSQLVATHFIHILKETTDVDAITEENPFIQNLLEDVKTFFPKKYEGFNAYLALTSKAANSTSSTSER